MKISFNWKYFLVHVLLNERRKNGCSRNLQDQYEHTIGATDRQITVNEDGTGSLTDPMGGPTDLEGLSIDGNNFSGKADVSSPMGKMTLEFSAAVDGDSIAGNFQTPMGPMQFTGERE